MYSTLSTSSSNTQRFFLRLIFLGNVGLAKICLADKNYQSSSNLREKKSTFPEFTWWKFIVQEEHAHKVRQMIGLIIAVRICFTENTTEKRFSGGTISILLVLNRYSATSQIFSIICWDCYKYFKHLLQLNLNAFVKPTLKMS
ncbi:hypothetical protein J3Q64DRAFT_1692682 [Phycomyces blakesleeanus]|uniref:Uncharacterized protein n=2 Tax=Phycomyces blakesleeanus TaxID=4837 RepID=A0A167PD22_PHYB8|nr:hypothetical protein PHYBLDRAFT_60822 [Phycomyces blakesleeanus NRRL 1555(-)]OAD77694.1 hypothetical protein PHYBLDRAFT_60822 [Phycomyces blakesleeanus NRRL 1555(-)]|eukprot:XP_018295734.1 hypothetical protein PHYBLDRAFT_60822 [Phycomyces blakesleeanus NRRL 1555(-)]